MEMKVTNKTVDPERLEDIRKMCSWDTIYLEEVYRDFEDKISQAEMLKLGIYEEVRALCQDIASALQHLHKLSMKV